jgi:hypothetical protein
MANLIKHTSTQTAIALLTEGQASGEVTQNQISNLLDLFAGGITLVDRDILAAPGSPTTGQAYLIPASGTIANAWATDSASHGDIAVYLGGWIYITPGSYAIVAYVTDEKLWIAYSEVESEWHPLQDSWSTTEHWTGKYAAVGGGKIYSKTVNVGALPNATTATTAHSISTIDFSGQVRFEFSLKEDTLNIALPGNGTILIAGAALVEVTVNATNVAITTNFDATAYDIVVRIEYEKA